MTENKDTQCHKQLQMNTNYYGEIVVQGCRRYTNNLKAFKMVQKDQEYKQNE